LIGSRPSPPKIAFLVKRFPRLSETFILNEVLELRRQGIPLKLFSLLDPKELTTQIEAENMRAEVLYLRTTAGLAGWIQLVPDLLWAFFRFPAGVRRSMRFVFARKSVATLRHLMEAARLVRQMRRANVVHLHAHFAHGPAAVADLARRVSGIPYSFTAHAKDLYTTPAENIAARIGSAAFVATCTEQNGAYLASLATPEMAAKIHVIPHGVDGPRFSAVNRAPVRGRIVSIGRLVPKKGFFLLLDSLKLLSRAGVTFDCRIFGDGPLREQLLERVRALNLADRVSFLGARPQGELLGELGEAEIFVLSSVVMEDGDRDGIPNVLLEAMAAGVPVVATAVSAIPELIRTGETGLLVDPRPEPLGEALKEILQRSELRQRLAEAGRDAVLQQRALDRSVQPLSALFRARLPCGDSGGRA
jgi:glycosyltransferase involved in cell wall biosynthesis